VLLTNSVAATCGCERYKRHVGLLAMMMMMRRRRRRKMLMLLMIEEEDGGARKSFQGYSYVKKRGGR